MTGKQHKNTKTDDDVDNDVMPWNSVSFACGGWLQFYLYGVARGFQAHGLNHPNTTFLGCSAGALSAAGLAVDGDFDQAIDYCKKVALPRAYGELFGLFKLHEYVGECLDVCMVPIFKDIPPGRLQVAISSLPWLAPHRVIEFRDAHDLKQALLASTAAFPAARLVYRNVGPHVGWFMDGGVTDFQPVVDENTLRVSPFYFSDADIKPSRYVPFWWAFLPPNSPDTIDWIYHLGYKDAMDYFAKHNISETSRCRPHIKEIMRKEHAYDSRGRVSWHRFLGFELPFVQLSKLFDMVLLLLLVIVWRPLALMLIYGELFCLMVVQFTSSLVLEIIEITPLLLFGLVMFWHHATFACGIAALVCVEKLLLYGFSNMSYEKLKQSHEYFCCLCSLSLLLRFVNPVCSAADMTNKHQQLVKVSLLYRVFCHMI